MAKIIEECMWRSSIQQICKLTTYDTTKTSFVKLLLSKDADDNDD